MQISYFPKLLGFLILLQIAVLTILFLKIDAFDARLDKFAISSGKNDNSEPAIVLPTTGKIETAHTGIDSRQLRRIIREEIQAANLMHPPASDDVLTAAKDRVAESAEKQYQRDLVIGELDYLKQQHEVTSGEIEKLMGDIAQLDPKARSELLKMLNQAINRGEIKGHL